MKTVVYLLLSVSMLCASCNYSKDSVVVYSAPEGEELNTKFNVSVNGVEVPVYNAKICTEDQQGRHKAGNYEEAHLHFDITAFASFDMKKGPVKISVSVNEPIVTAKILPTSFGIIPIIKGKTVTFEVDKPQHVTVEINGDHIRSLHVFVNPEETDIPDPNDPNVMSTFKIKCIVFRQAKNIDQFIPVRRLCPCDI